MKWNLSFLFLLLFPLSVSADITSFVASGLSGSSPTIKLGTTDYLTFASASNTNLRMQWGDGGVTAAQNYIIAATTLNGDDDSKLFLCGGGLNGGTGCSGGFGATIEIDGNESDNKGDVLITTGDASGSDTAIGLNAANSLFTVRDSTNTPFFTFTQSDKSLTWTGSSFLTGPVSAGSVLIGTNSVDAADSNIIQVCGGATNSAARGACMVANGNEASGGGDIIFDTGDSAGSNIIFRANRAAAGIDFRASTNNVIWTIAEDTGKFSNGATAGGDIWFVKTGTTLGVDSGTAASACAGTGTHNGTTAVTISTTCATTGNRIFFADTSEPTASSGCWVTNVVNATSFDVDCKSANQDATFAWWIQREA